MSRENSVNIFAIADTHFSHNKLVQEGLKSPEEDKNIIKSLQIVKVDDILIHLGDVSFYDHEYWHIIFTSACAGKKILVLGNHDRQTLTWYYKHGWDFVCSSFTLKAYGQNLMFSHRPCDFSEIMGSSIDTNIHGHLHNDGHRDSEITGCNSKLVYNKIVNIKTLLGK